VSDQSPTLGDIGRDLLIYLSLLWEAFPHLEWMEFLNDVTYASGNMVITRGGWRRYVNTEVWAYRPDKAEITLLDAAATDGDE
jgi:hypothetical protein